MNTTVSYLFGIVSGVFWLLTITISTSTAQHVTAGVLMLFVAIQVARNEIMDEIRKVPKVPEEQR